jgi:hypothetical protein
MGVISLVTTGALIRNTGIWSSTTHHVLSKKGQWQEALEALLKWHLKELWFPGLMAEWTSQSR